MQKYPGYKKIRSEISTLRRRINRVLPTPKLPNTQSSICLSDLDLSVAQFPVRNSEILTSHKLPNYHVVLYCRDELEREMDYSTQWKNSIIEEIG